MEQIRTVFIVPVYNNGNTISAVVNGIKNFSSDIIVVNDGSSDGTAEALSHIENIHVITLPKNQGKGMALKAGFDLALKKGFTHAITFDADGQHLHQDIPVLLQKISKEPQTLWIGDRLLAVEGGKPQPARSRFGRQFGAFWYKYYTGLHIRDTQCGLRCYPLQRVVDLKCKSKRYEFEIEILIAAAWSGIPVKSVAVHMLYLPREKRVSHFRPVRDFLRISKVNGGAAMTRIFFPRTFVHTPGAGFFQKVKTFIFMELKMNATPFKAAMSLAVGTFIAIMPIHGIQVVTLLLLSYIFKLNRPLTLLAVTITSPPTLPFWIAAGLIAGKLICPQPLALQIVEICKSVTPDVILNWARSWNAVTFAEGFVQWALGSVLLAIIGGVAAFFIAYPIFKKFKP